MYSGLLAVLRVPVLGEGGRCLFPDELCSPVSGWDPTPCSSLSPRSCAWTRSVNAGNPLARPGLWLCCACRVASASTSVLQRPQTCLPHAAVGPMPLRGLCKGFVKGDPKGWTLLHAAEAGLLPSMSVGASMHSMGLWCPGQNKAVLSQA